MRGSSIARANILPMSGIVQRCTKNKEIGRYICVPVEGSRLPDNKIRISHGENPLP